MTNIVEFQKKSLEYQGPYHYYYTIEELELAKSAMAAYSKLLKEDPENKFAQEVLRRSLKVHESYQGGL